MNLRNMTTARMRLEITAADSISFLNALNTEKIKIRNVTYRSELIFNTEIIKNDFAKLTAIAQKQGVSVKILGISGLQPVLQSLTKHPVLIACFACLLFFTIFLPTRVFFIGVEGNYNIPANQILEAANECGIRFGASRRKIRSEIMKNTLLQKVPQLQWAGINTTGCTAVISVREKTPQDMMTDKSNKVCSIVATRDGVIQNCTVYEGNPLCTVGQAVKSGQTLVSGYLDCGLITKATQANAEITALTFRELSLVAPFATAFRGQEKNKNTTYSLRVGKKVIKISKDSGNFDGSCAKIYTEEYVCLPGGFRLPVCVVKETEIFYNNSDRTEIASDSEQWLVDAGQNYLKSTMIAGEVISEQTQIQIENDVSYLSGRYTCLEMIGQTKYEQMMLKD